MSAPTSARLEANRENSKLSTGPVTEAGKKRSSLNAIRHGLTSRTVVLPGEDMAAYNKFSQELITSLRAETPIEIQFAQTVADNYWRINRIKTIEDGMLSFGLAAETATDPDEDPNLHNALAIARAFQENSRTFANLSICEQRLHRVIKQALQHLEEAQTTRKAEQAEQVKTINAATPANRGFVFANTEIPVETHRREPRTIPIQSSQPGPDTNITPKINTKTFRLTYA